MNAALLRLDDVRALADDEVLRGDPARLEFVELLEKRLRIDDDSVADDAGRLRIQDAARDQVKAMLLAAGHHRVAGVVPTL